MQKNESILDKIALIAAMLIFGTIGIFKKAIPLPSGTVAMFRGITGAFMLMLILLITGRKINFEAIKKHIGLLIISGAFIGFNWILLFESYNYTSVATATLCYYMAPVFVIFASPLLLNERLTVKQLICSLFAITGMVLVSGFFEVGFKNPYELIGVGLGLGAALLYAGVIIMNKKMPEVGAFEKTVIQLSSAGITIIPYTLLFEDISFKSVSTKTILLILILGFVHTAIAYTLYFSSLKSIKAQTAAIFSYIDPIFAIILSVLVLKENMSTPAIIGSIIVLGATLISEIKIKKTDSH